MLHHVSQEYGVDDPAKLMESFYEANNEVLLTLRNYVTNPEERKTPRTWSSIQAAELVGVSTPTLRKLSELHSDILGVSCDINNRKRYNLEAINQFRRLANKLYLRPHGSYCLTIVIANLKGGVGKTTTTVELAKKAAMIGLRVLLIDLDAQGTATLVSSGLIPDLEIKYEETITEILLDEPENVSRVIRKTHFDGLDIIPANLAIQDCDLGLPNNTKNNVQSLGSPLNRLDNALNTIKDKYDLILIDCGPNLGMLTLNAIKACNGMIIPIPPNMYDYASFTMYTGSLKNLFQRINKPLDYFRILLSKHKGDNESLKMESLMRKQFGDYILAKNMCETVEVARAASSIGTIYDLDGPEKNNAKSYRRAIQHLDDVNLEIINNFKEIWQLQANSAAKTEEGRE